MQCMGLKTGSCANFKVCKYTCSFLKKLQVGIQYVETDCTVETKHAEQRIIMDSEVKLL